jgi:branched-chain amino acid transport system ATP-binding protein
MFELTDVSAGYSGSTVLRNVNLKVPTGNVVAIVGANGAGKTTLLRVASGLLRPQSGSVTIDGRDLSGRRPHVFFRAGVCHVPEGRGIFRSLSVRENIILQAPPGTSTDEAVERAGSAFPRLGERMSQLAGTLSGGEQQMLALAHAYVSQPKVVLLDEVSMGLAPRTVDDIFDFLKVLASQGAALVIVEQYVKRAVDLADFVYVLTRGRVSFAGEPSEVDVDDLLRDYLGSASARTRVVASG